MKENNTQEIMFDWEFAWYKVLFQTSAMVLTIIVIFANFSLAIVPSSSMCPTIKVGTCCVVRTVSIDKIDYNDIITFYPNIANAKATAKNGFDVIFNNFHSYNNPYIKRLIGKPGDVIRIENGLTYRNGEPLDEPFINGFMVGDMEEYVVPEGRFFVMGDNRNNSADSRIYGSFDADAVIGKLVLSFDGIASIFAGNSQ